MLSKARLILHLVLVSSVVLLWVRSHHVIDGFYTPHLRFESYRGTIRITIESQRTPWGGKFMSRETTGDYFWAFMEEDLEYSWRIFGGWQGVSRTFPMSILCIPYWIGLIPAFSYVIITAKQRFVARRRRANGLCTRCGYDLRNGITRCPECGHLGVGSGKVPIGG
jgi:hypothetical protein